METINRQYKNHKGFANNIIKTTLLKEIAVYIKNVSTHPIQTGPDKNRVKKFDPNPIQTPF